MEDAKGGRILLDPEHKLGPGPYFHHLMGPGKPLRQLPSRGNCKVADLEPIGA